MLATDPQGKIQRVLSVDVLVLGGGGAGLAAAVEAAERGARVLLIEKDVRLGGSTAMSVGSFTSSGTDLQTRALVNDSHEVHALDLAMMNAQVRPEEDPELRRILAERAPETFAWLQKLGVEFVGPFAEPPHRAPRMYNVVPSSRAYVDALTRRSRACGVKIICDAPAQSLVVERGQVVGAVVKLDGGDARIDARATILATGDLSAAPHVLHDHQSASASTFVSVNQGATGDGHRMASAAGAALCRNIIANPSIRFAPSPRRFGLERLPTSHPFAKLCRLGFENLPAALVRAVLLWFLTSVLQPHPSLYGAGAILVNRRGERFADETCPMAARALAQQPDGVAHIIFDSRIADLFSRWPNFLSTAPGLGYAYVPDLRRYRADLCRTGRSLAAVAEKIDVDPVRLSQTIDAYNEQVTGSPRLEITRPPFFAIGPVRPYLVLTDGGLIVDTQMRVKQADGRHIAGLYAAGAVGQGELLLQGHGHHLAWAFVSGRAAGENAAAFAGDRMAEQFLKQVQTSA